MLLDLGDIVNTYRMVSIYLLGVDTYIYTSVPRVPTYLSIA